MNNGKIISLDQAGQPGREILKAAGDLLNAVVNQYPRAAPDIMAGVTIRIISKGGAVLEISGGAAPTGPGGLITPGGAH